MTDDLHPEYDLNNPQDRRVGGRHLGLDVQFAHLSQVITTVSKQNAVAFAILNERIMDQMPTLNPIHISISLPDIYIPTIDTAGLQKAFDVSAKVAEIVKSAANTYTQQIAEAMNVLDAAMQQYVVSITAIKISLDAIISSGIVKHFQKLVQVEKEVIEAFQAANWPIPPSMSRDFRYHIVDLHHKKKTRYISNAIIGYYHRNQHKNLKAMVENWQNHLLFAPRMHIMRDALEAHCQGKYTLSIPALIPQVEGILNDYVMDHDLPAKLGRIQKVYNAVIGDPDGYAFSKWAIASTLLYQLQENIYVYTDFENELKKSANRRQTTRHTVSHGLAINYHRPINSLKYFLLLDAISALKEYENPESVSSH